MKHDEKSLLNGSNIIKCSGKLLRIRVFKEIKLFFIHFVCSFSMHRQIMFICERIFTECARIHFIPFFSSFGVLQYFCFSFHIRNYNSKKKLLIKCTILKRNKFFLWLIQLCSHFEWDPMNAPCKWIDNMVKTESKLWNVVEKLQFNRRVLYCFLSMPVHVHAQWIFWQQNFSANVTNMTFWFLWLMLCGYVTF